MPPHYSFTQTLKSPQHYSKYSSGQWLLIYLVIGGLVYAAVYYFYLAKKGTSPYDTVSVTVSQTANQNSVSFSSAGFKPTSLTIKTGESVTWLNESNTDISLNSAPHPTHTDYPPLNLGLLKPGNTKSLTFPTAGVYKYHNHFNSSQYGSITVQ